jgi:hypothetical protein
MSQVQFKDVAENTVFKSNGIEYKKIGTVKISCCRSINAEQVDNPAQRTFVPPNTEVEVNDQQQ